MFAVVSHVDRIAYNGQLVSRKCVICAMVNDADENRCRWNNTGPSDLLDAWKRNIVSVQKRVKKSLHVCRLFFMYH